MELKNVICETPEQFHAECKKWQQKGAAPIVRGRKLIAYGETVAELVTSQRGGARVGAGRPAKPQTTPVCFRISPEAAEKLKLVENKSELINKLILKAKL